MNADESNERAWQQAEWKNSMISAAYYECEKEDADAFAAAILTRTEPITAELVDDFAHAVANDYIDEARALLSM